MDFELLRGSGRRVLRNPEIPEGLGGGGGHHKPSGMEILRGWGVKIRKPSVGGVWIFSGTAQCTQISDKTHFSLTHVDDEKICHFV